MVLVGIGWRWRKRHFRVLPGSRPIYDANLAEVTVVLDSGATPNWPSSRTNQRITLHYTFASLLRLLIYNESININVLAVDGVSAEKCGRAQREELQEQIWFGQRRRLVGERERGGGSWSFSSSVAGSSRSTNIHLSYRLHPFKALLVQSHS